MAHPQPPQQGGHVNRQFPPAFYLYSTGLGRRKYVLDEHKNKPLYAVATQAGWSGKADTVLHSGPSSDAPPLATVAGGNTIVSPVDVDLRGAAQGSSPSSRERMKPAGFGYVRRSMQFEMGVGGGRRGAFGWRHSNGPEVGVLVRLGGEGGEEVVAAWAGIRMNLVKKSAFQFLGSGLTGILGERWAVMAVITALRMWDREAKMRGAAAGGSMANTGSISFCNAGCVAQPHPSYQIFILGPAKPSFHARSQLPSQPCLQLSGARLHGASAREDEESVLDVELPPASRDAIIGARDRPHLPDAAVAVALSLAVVGWRRAARSRRRRPREDDCPELPDAKKMATEVFS
ncbi:hypothetical protein DL765_009861 [Monosporascus sp. GIB2]|nr:hypothetical protein DL765_009861 [Monosporascus sp. GIB2]